MQTVKEWIWQHEPEFLSDLKNLIRFPSVSRKNGDGYPFGAACRAVLRETLACADRFGLQTRNFEDYCGTAWIPGSTWKSIGIFAHLDVVPEGNGWSQNPYEMTVTDGIICGRGCADNKGPALAALYALRYLVNSGYKFQHTIFLFLGCNEEVGMEDVAYYLEMEKNHPVFSFVPDANFSICVGEKGELFFVPLEG